MPRHRSLNLKKFIDSIPEPLVEEYFEHKIKGGGSKKVKIKMGRFYFLNCLQRQIIERLRLTPKGFALLKYSNRHSHQQRERHPCRLWPVKWSLLSEQGSFLVLVDVPTGSRTPVTGVKGRCPGPLDDGDLDYFNYSLGSLRVTSCEGCACIPLSLEMSSNKYCNYSGV